MSASHVLREGLILEAWTRSGRALPQRQSPSGTYSVRCVFPDNHEHGDRSPSAYLDPARNIYGCPCLSEPLTVKAFCEMQGVDFSDLLREHGAKSVAGTASTKTTKRASLPATRAAEAAKLTFTPDDAGMLTYLALSRNAAQDPVDADARTYLGERGLLAALDSEHDSTPLVGLVPPTCDTSESEGVREAVRVLGQGGYRILAPLYSADGGRLVAVQGRFVGNQPPDDWRKGARTWSKGSVHGALFANVAARALVSGESGSPGRAVLCEGLTDWLAVSLHAPEGMAVIGIPGVANVESVLARDVNAGRGSKKRELQPWVRACAELVLALDNDQEGSKATEKARLLLESLGAKTLRVRVAAWTGGRKDACELLAADGANAMVSCLARAPQIAGPEPVHYLDLATLASEGIPPMRWLVEGWVAERDEVLLVGTPGGGKSTTVGSLAVALANGQPEWCGLRITRPIRVLVFDEEQGEMEAGRLYVRLSGHVGPAGANLRVAAGAGLVLSTPEGVARLEEEIRVFRPELVVLDSATTIFAVADENNSAQVAGVYRELHRLRDLYGIAFLIIHHRRKAAPNGNDVRVEKIDLARGSSSFGTQSSCVVLAVMGPKVNTLDLYMVKRRGGERKSLRTEYASNGPEGAITISSGGTIRNAEMDRASDFIIDFLAEREATRRKDIEAGAKANEISRRSVGRALDRLKNDGILVQPRRGEWALAADPSYRDLQSAEVIPIDGLVGGEDE